MLLKVISGGQNGADQAGLRAAKESGLATGGWLPRGCLTLDGPCPWLKEVYGCQEHASDKYPPRTFANVRMSDASLRLAYDFQTPGEKCTLRALNYYQKPYLDIDLYKPPTPKQIQRWLRSHRVQILNIAGNSKRFYPCIEEIIYTYLLKVFEIKKRKRSPSRRHS